jgi:hypothetical protein
MKKDEDKPEKENIYQDLLIWALFADRPRWQLYSGWNVHSCITCIYNIKYHHIISLK